MPAEPRDVTRSPLVTVALPVFRRLDYLPQALDSVRRQEYPRVELIVSDNGDNPAVQDLIARHYGKPYRFRRNPATVPPAVHFNQLLDAASGAYFALLSDDDEISPNFLSTLVARLDQDPRASLAICRVETMDASGHTMASTDDEPLPPSVMTGLDFIRAWCLHTHNFICLTTNLSRTADLRTLGAYPLFASGHKIDNALVVKQCLAGHVVFSHECTFRYRIHSESYGQTASCAEMAQGSREFLRFLDADPCLLRHAEARSEAWTETKALLVRMTYRTYLARWRREYGRRASTWAWIRDACALPGSPAAYARALIPRAFYA